ncbi:hypothetical protein HMI01_20330 [Halolactibacillus miurensis]|uniref:Uncharacterized protein n=1 Tax=Halolactibacillus miurensis TaxID=306541 RepID=A0ABQ0VYB5_9BACI|nr:hypothetical protein HMI01_20330 [Halolactibacillus miurensis]
MRQLILDIIEMLRETTIQFRTCENSTRAIYLSLLRTSYVKEAICRPIGTMDASRIIG